MRFLTWNIQSGGGKRVPLILKEMEGLKPDFIALTEVTFNNLNAIRASLEGKGFVHLATTCSDGTTNSVLVASKVPFVVTEEPMDHDPERWLSVEIDSLDLKILCVHIPGSTDNKFGADGIGMSGKKRKELFWDQVLEYAQRHKHDRTVLLGDFNTGLPEDAQGTPFELSDRIRILRLEKYADTWRTLNPKAREYTWYSKRRNKQLGTSEDFNGFRLDYIYVSSALKECVVGAEHVDSVRKEGVSDHAILMADLLIDGSVIPAISEEDAPAQRERQGRRPSDYEAGWGELIRAYRMYIGISQRCLAERLKMSEKSLSDIEVGRRDCPPGFVNAVEDLVKEFDADIEKIIRSASSDGQSPMKKPISVEVTEDVGGEWARSVIGRAAVQSRLLIPVRPFGPAVKK
jgi:exodeoxyribonuclease-3